MANRAKHFQGQNISFAATEKVAEIYQHNVSIEYSADKAAANLSLISRIFYVNVLYF